VYLRVIGAYLAVHPQPKLARALADTAALLDPLVQAMLMEVMEDAAHPCLGSSKTW
jgi:hypothetical protein